MKRLFLILLGLLIAASCYTMLTAERRRADVPMIAWRSDPNPQRYEQIDLFHKWLIRNGHLSKSGGPACRMTLDTAENQSTLIQAVSGMAGDIFDTPDVPGYAGLGVLTDITDIAKQGGFGLENTYPGLAALLSRNGRQYGYPCNAAAFAMWINADTFATYGMKPPPDNWTPDQFEAIGCEFVRRANAGRARQDVFFTMSLDSDWGIMMLTSLVRSRGTDLYNETQTRAEIDNEAFRDAFRRFRKWTYEDHLAPTAAEVASMNTDSGYGGGDYSNFLAGKYATIVMGRYCLIRFREFSRRINLTLCRMPAYEFKNLPLTVRAAVLYRGSGNPELARLFFEFLSDEEYNRHILEGADGLPPNPAVAAAEIPRIREKYPNEGDCHEREFEWAQTIAIPRPFSPFVKAGTTDWLRDALTRYFNGRCNLEEALRLAESRYNREILLSCEANPAARREWEHREQLQKQIDERKRSGRKIPAEWITNPFHLKYYREKDMLE